MFLFGTPAVLLLVAGVVPYAIGKAGRLAQAKLAASKEACVSAGPYGGDVCGRRCEAFCTVVEANCSATAPPPYSSRSTCIETCNGFPFDPKVGEGPDQPFKGADNLNCRGFHMILSLEDKVGHCPHTGATSATCLRPMSLTSFPA